jgi:hypothetical protein
VGRLGRSQVVSELVEVAHQGQREQLLLAGEVAVDDRPVDPDGPCDVLDLRLGHAPRVEQPAGGGEDRGLPGPTAYGGRRATLGAAGRLLLARHGRIVRRAQL